MAKNKSNKKGKSPKAAVKEQKRIVTMEALEEGASSDDEMPPEEEWTKEARALRQAIAEGAFDKLITDKNEADDDESIEEVVLDKDGNDGNDEDDDDDEEEEDEEMVADDDDEDEEVDQEEQEASDGDDSDASEEKGDLKKLVASEATDSEEEDEEEEDEDEEDNIDMRNAVSAKALSVVTEDLAAVNNSKPWAEKLAIVPPTPLPFGEEGQAGTTLDIHDDLKREVAFYDMALESVLEARIQCTDAGIPFSRPDDFFAEMVKTDDHMSMVKDRLIFENKKIDAVAQRKSNKEQKLRSKESASNKVAEKSRRKKDHFKELDDWAESAKSNRGQGRDDDDGRGGDKVNRKRMAADKKYGHGGKRGRFKQNDSKSKADVTGFNPRGNFAAGSKKTSGGSGSGGSRQGKRARDASRTRR